MTGNIGESEQITSSGLSSVGDGGMSPGPEGEIEQVELDDFTDYEYQHDPNEEIVELM